MDRAAPRRVVVKTELGRLVGRHDEGAPTATFFGGIPYATASRWRPSTASIGWTGDLDATSFGPSAPQPIGEPVDQLVPGMLVDRIDESTCLTLNVWTPVTASAGDELPVLVWIHGGAFSIGGSSLATYDGARLATEGNVIVVSINYRLGALGFMPFAALDAPANLGLGDQIAALQWIADHIAAFGGDPTRVAVFGESAGAGSIMHLLAMPAARGLFRGAVVQSGATQLTLTSEQAAAVSDEFDAQLQRRIGDADAMRASIDDVLAAQLETSGRLLASVGAMPFHPSLDPSSIPVLPRVALARGDAADVALIVGTTADEMRLYLSPELLAIDDDRLRGRAHGYLRHRSPDVDPAALLAAYAHAVSEDPGEIWARIQTDGEMWMPAVRTAEAHASHQPRIFMYRFDWHTRARDGFLRAPHAGDLPFTFGTFDREGWASWVGADDDASTLSHTMRTALTSFAHDAHPGWPKYDVTSRTTKLFDRVCSIVDDPMAEVREVWSRGYPVA